MRVFTSILAVVVGLSPVCAGAMSLELPSDAKRLAHRSAAIADYQLPIGAWTKSGMQNLDTTGAFSQQTWKIEETDLSTLEILKGLRQQLADAGFNILFECDTEACGGFDFRYETEVLAEPDMHVDLGDFRFLSAKRVPGQTPEYVSLLVSRSANTGFVQQIFVGQTVADTPEIEAAISPAQKPKTAEQLSLEQSLEGQGHFILEDLEFQTGSSLLGDGEFATLSLLATYLSDHPERKVALVGHTDAEGSLSSNVSLSKKRATAVLKRLVNNHDVNPAQLSAQGMGFLAPRSSNLTDDGRMENRRVEVILTSLE